MKKPSALQSLKKKIKQYERNKAVSEVLKKI